MGSMSELWDERQIQILVLLSFVLQVFLFFAGSIRYRSTNTFLRFSLWISYIGADAVAVYVLGLISRQQDAAPSERRLSEIQPLAFIWAPFLLIHLGGQDTITAFAMADNSLWLRHLLNLVLQLVLALYVFWKSTVWHNVHLLVTGICLFLAGTIKYGERIMALKYGKLLESYTSDDNKLPAVRAVDKPENYYYNLIRLALTVVVGAREVFDGRSTKQMNRGHWENFVAICSMDTTIKLKVWEIELRLIYDDLYTKALVLRRRIGIIGRSISLVSIVVAYFLIFSIPDKQKYDKADLEITYTLLVGAICLEVCAAFMMLLSAWTWGWLQARRCLWLANLLLGLLSSRIEKRNQWSNSMGQYEFVWWVGEYDSKSISWKQRVMKTLRATVKFLGVGKGTLFWFSKLLDTKEVTVDKKIMESFVQQLDQKIMEGRRPILPPVVSENMFVHDFGDAVVKLHMFTAVHLRDYVSPHDSTDDYSAVKVCLKLSNYMLYLLVTHSKMLPVNGSVEATLERFIRKGGDIEQIQTDNGIDHGYHPCKQSVKELRDIWINLFMYVASKSRPEMHAECLGRGGQLLTFVWLLLLHNDFGDLGLTKMELNGDPCWLTLASVFRRDQGLSRETWSRSGWSAEEATELAANPDGMPESEPAYIYPSQGASAPGSPSAVASREFDFTVP